MSSKKLSGVYIESAMSAASEIVHSSIIEQKHYTGQKTQSGIIEFLLNATPKADVYIELFCGSAVFSKKILELNPNATQLLVDKNSDVINYLPHELQAVFVNDCYSTLHARHLCDSTKDIFIYSDPPYLFSSRRSGRKYYKFEMSKKQHIDFLKHIQFLDECGFGLMISHPKCKLYDSYLVDWYTKEIKTSSRRGVYFECIYTNYNPSEIDLLTYDFLGDGFVDRQRINRSIVNMIDKISKLPLQHRKKMLDKISSYKFF